MTRLHNCNEVSRLTLPKDAELLLYFSLDRHYAAADKYKYLLSCRLWEKVYYL